MNQKRAKAIRKQVYGDKSRRDNSYTLEGRTVRCVGLRAEYKQEKKAYKEN